MTLKIAAPTFGGTQRLVRAVGKFNAMRMLLSGRPVTAQEVMSAILKAEVDLLWFGGIGTYVKASTETHSDIGDRANDAIRVNGNELRVKVVGEGGNLGWTQAGRIEFAAHGGRVNTDFIDNSAGVDTSDHEVNIKILLAPDVRAGRLASEARNELLASMTDDVAQLVLTHNVDQNLALSTEAAQESTMASAQDGSPMPNNPA